MEMEDVGSSQPHHIEMEVAGSSQTHHIEMEVVGHFQTHHIEMEVAGSSQTHHMEIGSCRAAPQPYNFQFPYINKSKARMRAEDVRKQKNNYE